MSTYDAYNLSLRDSTEFTVPTAGESGGDSNFSTAKLTVDVSGLLQTESDIPGASVPSEFEVIIPTISENGLNTSIIVPIDENISEYDIPLYKGQLVLLGIDPFYPSDFSGSVEFDTVELNGETVTKIIITGDVTYTPT